MREYYPNFLKFIDEALEMAKNIPRYFSKFSNRIYCNHQKLAILVLMQKLKTTSRGIVAWLRCNVEARLHLGLTRVPVHTTILRFAKSVNSIIGELLNIRKAKTVAVDATGFELESKSYYYRTVWNRREKVKGFMKLSLAIDADRQVIMTYRIRKKQRHDNLDFRKLLNKLKVEYVVADKGYDSKQNRKFVLYKLRAIPMIPYRKHSGVLRFPGGARLKFDEKIYHRRSKVETVFSVIKRKYGSVLRCRNTITQKVEVISKLIAYNIDKILSIFKEGCTTALFAI